MVDIEIWMTELSGRMQAQFGPRLLFLGLQGSYGRGEAGPDSDIDVVTVLDRVDLPDLEAYRTIVSAMPEGEKACGFLCGRAQLQSWPKYDLLSLARDTRDVYGTLKDLLPPFGRADLAQAAAVGASGLYHGVCHTCLYAPEEDWPAFLRQAEKSAFFVLRTLHELRTGENVRTKRDLLPLLSEDEREILAGSLRQGTPDEPPQAAFERLLRWSASAMAEAEQGRN